MNNIKLTMDNYFNGLNISLIRHQINTYGSLVKVVDETTLTDLVTCITGELNVKYEDESMGIALGFLNDYVNGEIGERTLLHCLIGACDRYTKNLPKDVLAVSHSVLTSIYNTQVDGTDERECDCANCSCGKAEEKGEVTYDLATIIKGILEGEVTIMDGDNKVPCEVMLSVADFMDKTNLSEEEFVEAVAKGLFKGEVLDTANSVQIKLLKPTGSNSSKGAPKQTLAEREAFALKKAMEKTEEMFPGSREKMLKASKALKNTGFDVEGMLANMIETKAQAEGLPISKEDIESIIKAVMNSSK